MQFFIKMLSLVITSTSNLCTPTPQVTITQETKPAIQEIPTPTCDLMWNRLIMLEKPDLKDKAPESLKELITNDDKLAGLLRHETIDAYVNQNSSWNALSIASLPTASKLFALCHDTSPTTIAEELKRCTSGRLFQDQAPTLYAMLEELTQHFDIAMPNITLIDESEFCAQQDRLETNLVIPFDSIQMLTNNEIQACLAHECAHLAREHEKIHTHLRTYDTNPQIEKLCIFISKSQEREADECALTATKNPQAFISAGLKILLHLQKNPQWEAYIISLHATHPSACQRICFAYNQLQKIKN